jgi:hypothetical protein
MNGCAAKKLKTFSVAHLLLIMCILLSPELLAFRSFCQSANGNIWYVHDVIDPSTDAVRWREEGAIEQTPSWIADGRWFAMSKRESLVASNDIFVSMYESFNWSVVQSAYLLPFSSFNEFVQNLINNKLSWLNDTWLIDTEWYGISANTTKISYSYDEATSEAQLWTWFHISRIPEYFVGGEKLTGWLTGFDLSPISTGDLQIYEFSEDSNVNGTYYSVYFEAPANVLSQHGDNFTFSIGISPSYRGRAINMQQTIDINMPADTEVKEMSPDNLSIATSNTASFVLTKDDVYPASFSVVSGSPTKPFGQVVWESVSVWLVTPGGWAAIATLIVLSFTAMRGRRIWHRNRLYHRMYKSMVAIYHLYSTDIVKFHQEMASLSSSIFQLVIEDRITDEQFERLLVRRDDLLKRMQSQQPPPPR